MVSAAAIAPNEIDLASIIRAYSDVTERLKHSHELLRSEVCRLRDELHEKNKELARRERLAALGEMAAGVAHEIRNPLGGIGLYASLLEKDLGDRQEQAELVRRIRVGVRNLESVVGDILAFAGTQEPNRQAVRLTAILDDVHAQLAPRLDAQQIVLKTDEIAPNVWLDVDTRQIERVLLNLVLNAIDAGGEGGHVWVRAGDDPTPSCMTFVTVEDNGPGIPAECLQRIFNPFFTTRATGTGLGLAIVHRIVEAHGGHVTAGNRPDGGARFVVSLPTAEDPSAVGG